MTERPDARGLIDLVLDHRMGAHGLPLMGAGDWNDGMNRVGHEGRGESVWLAWFLCATLDAMLPLVEQNRSIVLRNLGCFELALQAGYSAYATLIAQQQPIEAARAQRSLPGRRSPPPSPGVPRR